ncbi:hypothetical protein HDU82_001948, partial [Entophlyctis luteolus]
DPWLRFHLRMLEFPYNSIQYDLDVLALHVGWTKSKKDFSSTREWDSELIFSLTLLRRQDDEICRRLSLILLKIIRAMQSASIDDLGIFRPIVREIEMYVKLTGVSHLKHMLEILSGKSVL